MPHPTDSETESPPLRRPCGLLALACAVLLLATSCNRGRDSSKTPRNVVIIALDTLRADHLGCYGYARPTSPFLDRFAREGFVFENAQAQSAWTAPSLITVMTGLYTDVHQVCDSPNPGRMSPNVTTLAEVLKANGFETAAFTEGGYAKGQFGLDQGFDLYPANPGDSADDHSVDAHASRLAANVDRTLEWLKRPHERPFFLFFHTYEVHSPYRAPADLIRSFRPGFDEEKERAEVDRILTTWNRDRTITREDCQFLTPRTLLFRARTRWDGLPKIDHAEELARKANEFGVGPKDVIARPETQELVRDLYDAGIASADRGIERLLGGLRELGLEQDTLVVFVSDHGEGLGQHGQIEHGYELHEEIEHVVLMMRAPKLGAPARRIPDIVRLVDVVPTVLDLLGIDASKHVFQGQSLAPALSGTPLHLTAFSHGRTIERKSDTLYSARAEKWRLNYDLATETATLYDLARDPAEEAEVSTDHPDVVGQLRTALLRQHAQDLALQKALATNVRLEALDEKTLKELRGLGYAGGEPEKR
jgi:arylsulfatase A-like enzyme